MGCDIHINCEFKTDEDKWENCDFYTINPYYDKHIPKQSNEYTPKWDIVEVNVRRKYELFGVLAGVRCVNSLVIAEKRGIPADMSKQTTKRWDRECEWCHSFSWLTIKEIIEYKNRHDIQYKGFISQRQAEFLDEYGETPDTWSEYQNNSDQVYRQWKDSAIIALEHMLNELYIRMDRAFNIYNFYNDEKKSELRTKYSDRFRIVFWFDS